MGSEKRRAVIILSALAVLIGAVKATVEAVNEAVWWFGRVGGEYTFSKKSMHFIQQWFCEWGMAVFDSVFWILPLVGVCILVVFFIGFIAGKATRKWTFERKRKIRKVLFILSFVPIVLIFADSLYCMLFGYEIIFWMSARTYYGIEGFLYSFVGNVIVLSIVPILPLCLVWQIVYLVRRHNENKQF